METDDAGEWEEEQGAGTCSWTHLVVRKGGYVVIAPWFPVPEEGKLTVEADEPLHVNLDLPIEETVSAPPAWHGMSYTAHTASCPHQLP